MLACCLFTATRGASAQVREGDGGEAPSGEPNRAHVPADPRRDPTGAPAGASEKEKAKVLYEKGLGAYREHRYKDAIDALLAAAAAYPSPLLYFNISLVYDAMGDTASALAWLRRYVRESGGVADADAARRLSDLEARLQRDGVQQMSVFSVPDGGLVDIDGRRVGIAPVTIQLIPGNHLVTISLRGYAPARRTVELRADKSMDVRLALSHLASAEPAPTAVLPAPAKPDVLRSASVSAQSDRRGVSALAIASLGAGAGALGAALAFEVHRADAESDARQASQLDYAARVREMESAQTWSRVFLGVGAALTVAGGVKLWFDLSRNGNSRRLAGMNACGLAGLCGTARATFW